MEISMQNNKWNQKCKLDHVMRNCVKTELIQTQRMRDIVKKQCVLAQLSVKFFLYYNTYQFGVADKRT